MSIESALLHHYVVVVCLQDDVSDMWRLTIANFSYLFMFIFYRLLLFIFLLLLLSSSHKSKERPVKTNKQPFCHHLVIPTQPSSLTHPSLPSSCFGGTLLHLGQAVPSLPLVMCAYQLFFFIIIITTTHLFSIYRRRLHPPNSPMFVCLLLYFPSDTPDTLFDYTATRARECANC